MRKQDKFVSDAARLADIGIAVGGGLALFLFGYYLYHYSVTGERQFGSALAVGMSYCVPLGAAVFLFVSLTCPPSQRINLFITLVTSIVSIYTLELVIEWRFSSLYSSTRPMMTLLGDSSHKQKDADALTREFGLAVDTRSADKVLADLREKGIDAVPVMTPANHLFMRQPDGSIKSAIEIDGQEVMPLGGISHRTTLLCNENGEFIHYASDSHGFNNAEDLWHADRVEMAVLGDSFAHGYCVPGDRNFVALIRRSYPATLNLGVAGDGPLLMLATFKEYLPVFKPALVLWFYFEGNDPSNLQIERKSALLQNYLKDGFTQASLARQSDIDSAILGQIPRQQALDRANRVRRLQNRPMDRLMTVAKLETLRQRLGLVGGFEAGDREIIADLSGANMHVFRDILLSAKQLTSQWGGQLVFVYLPDWARYAGHSSPDLERRGDVLTMVRDLDVPLIDMVPSFEAHGDPLSLFPFRRSGHYNEEGHKLVADVVLKALSSLKANVRR